MCFFQGYFLIVCHVHLSISCVLIHSRIMTHWGVDAIYYSQYTVGKLRHSEVQLLARGQIAGKWESEGSYQQYGSKTLSIYPLHYATSLATSEYSKLCQAIKTFKWCPHSSHCRAHWWREEDRRGQSPSLEPLSRTFTACHATRFMSLHSQIPYCLKLDCVTFTFL